MTIPDLLDDVTEEDLERLFNEEDEELLFEAVETTDDLFIPELLDTFE
jgi:hypothetical protein